MSNFLSRHRDYFVSKIVLFPVKNHVIVTWVIHRNTVGTKMKIQSTLVISKSKGPSETFCNICASTYQIRRIEEKKQSNNQISQMNM